MQYYGFLLMLLSLCILSWADFGNVVTISQGKLKGFPMTTDKGKAAVKFQGIPYAEAPLGKLRFKHPKPHKRWEGLYEANQLIRCLQPEEFSASTGSPMKGQEDCLHLNVYVPEAALKGKALVPVMVWIHGGGFLLGDATPELYGPDRFLDHDVIVVAMNYRLGPLGFLSMGDDIMPPNLGLWDQNLALKWVKKNINFFGGDPEKVTIFGESAGSMSVFCHLVSRHSSGLFQGAIAQSGDLYSSFMKTAKHPAYYARTIAYLVGCDSTGSSESILQCLQNARFEDMMESSQINKLVERDVSIMENEWFYHLPVADEQLARPFFTQDPVTILESGEFSSVPVMLGYNKDEGLAFIGAIDETGYNKFRDDPNFYLPKLMFNRLGDDIEQADIAAIRIAQKEYLDDKPVSMALKEELLKLQTDSFCMPSTYKTAKALTDKHTTPVYHYRYSFQGPVSLMDFIKSQWKIPLRMIANSLGLDIFRSSEGVSHADELFMMWRAEVLEPIRSRWNHTDYDVSNNLLTMWTNFAKYGNPTPDDSLGFKWDRVGPGEFKVLDINSKPRMHMDPDELRRIKVWDKIWSLAPQVMTAKTSETWKNPSIHKQSLDNKMKDEL